VSAFVAFFGAPSESLTSPRALLWEHLIHQVILLLEIAERRIQSTEGQEKYAKLDGWWRVSKTRIAGKLCKIPSEEALSEALFEEMERVKEEAILKIAHSNLGLENLDTLQLSLETPRRAKRGIGKRAKPTDIRVYRTGSEIMDLRIEAKIILTDQDLRSAYLSERGLKRFSDPSEPYTDHEIGGMLAYTVSGDRTTWQNKIDGALNTSTPPIATFKHRVRMMPTETLFSRVPFPAGLGARNEVLVFHLVLNFDSDPSSR
jgi:hypothetical protein